MIRFGVKLNINNAEVSNQDANNVFHKRVEK